MTTIARATPDDIPDVMRLERGDGFEVLVGRWSADEHAAEMAKPGSRHLVSRDEADRPDGFVLLQGLDDPHGCATLRRIAVARPGAGLGPHLVAAALDQAFGTAGRIVSSSESIPRTNGRAVPMSARASPRRGSCARSRECRTAAFVRC